MSSVSIVGPVVGAKNFSPLQPGIDPHLGLNTWTSSLGALAYADAPGYRVTAGEPRCEPEGLCAFLEEFERDCRASGRKALYFGLPASAIQTLITRKPRGLLRLGEAPIFHLDRWSHAESVPKAVRLQARRAHNHGVRVRHLASPPADTGALRECLNRWLRGKGLPPLVFATSPFLLNPWPREGVFVAEREGKVCGYLTTSASLFRDVLRVDAIVRSPDAPNGCPELLVAAAFQAAWARGWDRATLGLAPLALRSADRDPDSPLWFRAFATVVRRAGFPGYSFAGLEAFKAKFRPDAWLPLYAVSQSGHFTPADFTAMLRVFAGGSLLTYGGNALLWKMGFRPPRYTAGRNPSERHSAGGALLCEASLAECSPHGLM